MREMKDSGIEWIGEIPSSWQILRVKDLFNITRGRVISVLDLDEDGEYPVYSSQTENNGCFGYLKSYDYSKPAITWTTDGAKAGTVFYREGKYNCTNVCGILQPKIKILNLPFLTYAIACVAAENKRYDINGYKIMSNEMANIHFAYPSSSEQKKIADFLDRKCSEIDALTADIQTQIETLEEYKKSVITEAVTKGLDPNVEMKDSGVEWIKAIPSNWNISKIDQLYVPRNTKVSDFDYQPLSVTMQGIVPQLESAAKTNAHDSRKLVMKGDFAINSRSDRRGSCGISEYTGSVSLINTVLKPKEDMNARYYNWLFHTSMFSDEFYRWGHGIVDDLWSTGWQEMKKISIPSPSLDEQHKIADFLDQKCSEIDQTISEKQQQLETLAEYKKSLIYEYVTGKREVA